MIIREIVITQITCCGDEYSFEAVPMTRDDHRTSREKIVKSLRRLVGNDPRGISFVLQIMGERGEEEAVIFPKGEGFKDIIAYLRGIGLEVAEP